MTILSVLAGIVSVASAATVVNENFKLMPGQGEMLQPRDFGDGICVIGSTCDECFGEGFRVCDRIGCFNPDKHQQCCKDAGSYPRLAYTQGQNREAATN